MSKLISDTPKPRTRASIRQDLKQLGVQEGMTVIVHSSLSSMGWVNGGAVAVTQALMDVVTEQGTIIMPAQSDDMSDPAKWSNPPVPTEWVEEIRNTMPAYHPAYTPASRMGKIVEVFRTFPGVSRSAHPLLSFVGWGKHKDRILENHSNEFGLGESSPLRKLYDLDALVLLIGADYDTCTCFHLAEYRIPKRTITNNGVPVLEDGKRVWKQYQDIAYRDELFPQIGKDFEDNNSVRTGLVGSAQTRLFSSKQAVDYAEDWLKRYDERK